MGGPSAGREIRVRLTRIALQPGDRRGRDDADLKAGGPREAREHIAVAAVVAAAADDDDPQRPRPAGPQVTQRGLTGALHQGIARNAQVLDGVLVQGTHLGN